MGEDSPVCPPLEVPDIVVAQVLPGGDPEQHEHCLEDQEPPEYHHHREHECPQHQEVVVGPGAKSAQDQNLYYD